MPVLAPTHETYSELKQAFDHFNQTLFNGLLEEPLFTLQRERRTYGYHSTRRFVQRGSGAMVDEIAMNPAYFSIRPIRTTLSTLVHEMVHQWQDHHGKPGRGGYHNRQWADFMESIGLMPSNTGGPGGKRTGDQMTHYIIEGGLFDVMCAELLTSTFTLSWMDRYPAERPRPVPAILVPSAPVPASGTPEPPRVVVPSDDLDDVHSRLLVLPPETPNKSNRFKYVCGDCAAQVWGKPGLRLLCAGRTVRRGKEYDFIEHKPKPMQAEPD